jgi:hypothetical protein
MTEASNRRSANTNRTVAGQNRLLIQDKRFDTSQRFHMHWLHCRLETLIMGIFLQASNDRFDIVCLVRQWMADQSLSQPPLLVYPAELRRDSGSFFQRLNSPSVEDIGTIQLDPVRQTQLKVLANFLGTTYGTLYAKGAGYIKCLGGDGTISHAPLLPLTFLTAPRRFSTLRPEARLAPIPDDLIPWRLKVIFRKEMRNALRAVRDEE